MPAHYLAGYAVECGIKAYVAKQTRQYDFPPDRAFVDKIYKHEAQELVNAAAGLQDLLQQERSASRAFALNWDVVKRWSYKSRYSLISTQAEARELILAVDDPISGVLTWLKKLW